MEAWGKVLAKFILQAQKGDLKTSEYPKEWNDLKLRVSFGMGAPARVPWIAFIAPEMQVSKGFYPVYLYYKELETLILAYGVSETEEFGRSWPAEIINSTETVAAFFKREIPRYGDSFVFKAYKTQVKDGKVSYLSTETNSLISEIEIDSDLKTILGYYLKEVSVKSADTQSDYGQGVFYMEKQLEDFIIHNWNNTEFGKKYDLIVEEGVLVSQQYKTEIGPIDILAKDKVNGNFVVIELKKNQTSDDTIGQLARYMGWIQEIKRDKAVRGIIIAGSYDKKLDYALKMMKNVEVYIYEVNFRLTEFKGTR